MAATLRQGLGFTFHCSLEPIYSARSLGITNPQRPIIDFTLS